MVRAFWCQKPDREGGHDALLRVQDMRLALANARASDTPRAAFGERARILLLFRF
jgi:hypothetical protein